VTEIQAFSAKLLHKIAAKRTMGLRKINGLESRGGVMLIAI